MTPVLRRLRQAAEGELVSDHRTKRMLRVSGLRKSSTGNKGSSKDSEEDSQHSTWHPWEPPKMAGATERNLTAV